MDPHRTFIIEQLKALAIIEKGNIRMGSRIRQTIRYMNNGWDIGFENPFDLPMNQRTIKEHQYNVLAKTAIANNLSKELETGRILPVNKKPPNIIPLIAIDKKTGREVTMTTAKVRVCRHGSSSTANSWSINELTPDANCAVVLPYTKDFCTMILKAGRYCYLFKTDLADAFRQLGLNKSQWKYIGYEFLNKYMIDTRDVYGTRSGSKHTQEFGELMIACFINSIRTQLKSESELTILNYIDDYAGAITAAMNEDRTRSFFLLNSLYDFLKRCGIKESVAKRTGLFRRLEICGLIYDSISLTVEPSFKKREKAKWTLIKVIATGCMMMKEFESLLGSLQWFASLVWPGKAFLRRVRMRLTAYKAKHGETDGLIEFNEVELKDFKWWLQFVDILAAATMQEIVYEPSESEMEPMWTDGATNGDKEMRTWLPAMGAYYKGNWSSTMIPKQYINKYKCDILEYEKDLGIVHFEALAIVAAVHTFEKDIKPGTYLKLWCDNEGVCGVFTNKNSNDLFLMDCLRWLCMFAVERKVRFKIDYINTHENTLADPLSRFEINKFINNARAENMPIKPNMVKMNIPSLDKW